MACIKAKLVCGPVAADSVTMRRSGHAESWRGRLENERLGVGGVSSNAELGSTHGQRNAAPPTRKSLSNRDNRGHTPGGAQAAASIARDAPRSGPSDARAREQRYLMRAGALGDEHGRATRIEDVCARARVARGTFTTTSRASSLCSKRYRTSSRAISTMRCMLRSRRWRVRSSVLAPRSPILHGALQDPRWAGRWSIRVCAPILFGNVWRAVRRRRSRKESTLAISRSSRPSSAATSYGRGLVRDVEAC